MYLVIEKTLKAVQEQFDSCTVFFISSIWNLSPIEGAEELTAAELTEIQKENLRLKGAFLQGGAIVS